MSPEFSYPDYEAYRDSVRSISGLIAYRSAKVTLSNAAGMIDQRTSYGRSPMARLMAPGASNAEFAQVFIVSDNYFSVLGVSALHGRTFGPGNTAESVSPPSVLVSENYWRRRFAADPAMVGKINLNAYAERFVRSIKESCLDRLIFFGEGSLRKGIDEFVRHYHGERNHQGLGNRLIVASECQAGQGEQCSAVSVWAAC